MERIQTLVDKLYQQKQQNCGPAQLLLTVQLLQSELLKLQQKNGTLGTSKVAVTLPVNMNFTEEIIRSSKELVAKEEPVQKEAVVPAPEPLVPEIAEPVTSPYAPKEYLLRKPAAFQEEKPKEEPVRQTAPVFAAQQVLNPAFSAVVETPTLTQHQSRKELNEMIAEQKESLNDRLKQEKTEVVHVLKDTPIKDLRKGIGINDRFTFVNDLFRGDEAMYERSIKTINGFHILSEAEYWMNRELKFKLGWNDSKETVQHFYHLVRRRFA
jgi:hypothetical protein